MPQYITEFLDWLTNFINYEAVLNKYTNDDNIFSLEPIRDLTKRLGSPERATPAIHIAGSKGKGSTAKMLACILDEAVGEPIAIYASPHVYDFRERVCTTRGFLKDDIYQRSIDELKDVAERNNLSKMSWYELVTAFGFLCAKNAQTKYAVVETGCGGRLDATNIVLPEITIINRIELEHTALLGDTLEKIAAEKAGIIKEGVPVIVSKQVNDSVMEVFRKIANERGVPIYLVEENCQISNLYYHDSKMHVEISGRMFRRPLKLELKMLGEKQAENAALAALAAKVLRPDLDESVIERGLARTKMVGRFEQHGNVILDGAHTPSSINQVINTLESLYPNQKYSLLFSSVAGKDLEHIVPLFRGHFEKIYLTLPGSERDPELDEVEEVFAKNGLKFVADEDCEKIAQVALADMTGDEKMLVTGSFRLLEKVYHVLSKYDIIKSESY